MKFFLLFFILCFPLFSFSAGLINCAEDICTLADVLPMIRSLNKFLVLDLATPFAIIALAFGGFKMITSKGNSGEVSGAKDIIYYAILGLVVCLAAYFLIEVIVTGLTEQTVGSFIRE